MTFDEIVDEVAGRLNLTSTAALARIGREVNERYRRVLSAVGLPSSSRGVVSGATVIGYRYLTFDNCQKLLSVFNSDGRPLWEVSFAQLRNDYTARDGSPQRFAVSTVDNNSTTVFLDTTPTAVETLSADALVDMGVLASGDSPAFNDIFHDILVYGAKAIELDKMEKPELSKEAERQYEGRLSDLRYFLAVSATRTLVQGQGYRSNVVVS